MSCWFVLFKWKLFSAAHVDSISQHGTKKEFEGYNIYMHIIVDNQLYLR